MASKITLIEGTGRCICRICNKEILMGQLSIKFESYNVTGQVHSEPEQCLHRIAKWKKQ